MTRKLRAILVATALVMYLAIFLFLIRSDINPWWPITYMLMGFGFWIYKMELTR
jgi:hypothetical protein